MKCPPLVTLVVTPCVHSSNPDAHPGARAVLCRSGTCCLKAQRSPQQPREAASASATSRLQKDTTWSWCWWVAPSTSEGSHAVWHRFLRSHAFLCSTVLWSHALSRRIYCPMLNRSCWVGGAATGRCGASAVLLYCCTAVLLLLY